MTDALLDLVRSNGALELLAGPGCSNALADVLDCPASRIVLVASERAARLECAQDLLSRGARLYRNVRPNPTTEQALALSAILEDARPDAVVAIGGGSTIDLAKAARLLLPLPQLLDAGLRRDPAALRAEPAPLVAVPTTAGTGSEMTPFATLYRAGRKVSLDTPGCMPKVAVLDGRLVLACPRSVAMAAALDAMCHAVESSWSLALTRVSRELAAAAGRGIVETWSAVKAGDRSDPDVAQSSLNASAAAGQAIATTRTTAAHAFSYHLTARYQVPHGFACALSLGWIADYHWAERRRGPADFEATLRELGSYPQAPPDSPVGALRTQLDAALADRVVVPPSFDAGMLADYVESGLSMSSRLRHNPITFQSDEVAEWVHQSSMLRPVAA